MEKLNIEGKEYYYKKLDCGVMVYRDDGERIGEFGTVAEFVNSVMKKPSNRSDKEMQARFMKNLQELQGDMGRVEFAEKIGISHGTYYQYVTGRRFPSTVVLSKIAEKCGVSVDWLIGKN